MTTDARSEIQSINAKVGDAFRRGDAAAIASLYTREAQLLPAHSDFVRGSGAIRTFWQGAIDSGLKDATLQTVEVEVHGDTAIEVGTYKLIAANGAVADGGKYVVIWKKDTDGWKLHRDIWTTSQPASA